MTSKQQKNSYRVRYVKVIENLNDIATLQPKEKYMYRLMDSVIFHDFETALDVVIENFNEASNDNQTEVCDDKA